MSDEKPTIKVNDTRHHSADSKTEEEPKSGDGFTMKESQKEEEALQEIDFPTLIFSLAQNAFMGLGLSPDPRTNKAEKDLGMAKQHIDILGLLETKTKGNLSEEEQALLQGLLVDLRMKFVEASK